MLLINIQNSWILRRFIHIGVINLTVNPFHLLYLFVHILDGK
jgi:hypothetical protein